MTPKFSPIQTRILNLLSDGQPHKRAEVLACIGDEQATLANLSNHLYILKRILRIFNQDIVCEYGRIGLGYRRVILLDSSSANLCSS